MGDLIAALAGTVVAVILIVIMRARAEKHERVRSWVEDAAGLGLTHRFSPNAQVGSEAVGTRSGRRVAIRGPRDENDPPGVTFLASFSAPIPLGMELLHPPATQISSVYAGQEKLTAPREAAGWSLRAVQTETATELLANVAPLLAKARAKSASARIHDGGVLLEREGPLDAAGIEAGLSATVSLAKAIEKAFRAIDAEPPAAPVSWPDFGGRHELEVDADGERLEGHLRGAYVEAKLLHDECVVRVAAGRDESAWRWTRSEGLEFDAASELRDRVERALGNLPRQLLEVERSQRWIEARSAPLDAAALSALLHRLVDVRELLEGAADDAPYR